jgi:hypothetical protein
VLFLAPAASPVRGRFTFMFGVPLMLFVLHPLRDLCWSLYVSLFIIVFMIVYFTVFFVFVQSLSPADSSVRGRFTFMFVVSPQKNELLHMNLMHV